MGKIVAETAEFVTGVSDEVMEKAKRSFVPRYEMNATLIPITTPDENCEFKYINFSYSNPYDSLLRPYNAMVSSFAKGELNKENVGDKILNVYLVLMEELLEQYLNSFLLLSLSLLVQKGLLI